MMPIPAAAQKLAAFRTPEGARFPSCYRRLWMFSDEAKCLGKRVLMTDLDVLITRNIDHLFAPRDKFVGWQPKASWGGTNRIGGGLYLLTLAHILMCSTSSMAWSLSCRRVLLVIGAAIRHG
ncbi:hypothetical protein [Neopusillimonas aromaticivorans]|uniref:hypothetical protein n=1 Tax=Neopusillimonas aromaticivorans TaxID=2979868 RepID=UPI0025913377|nr:hypothetical protein [Neopusillimonas aromaticivorans]WJJ93437.1 hypothetical protein N7E01_15975 [Neopusillimonas aromaticivorans]